MGDPSEEVDKTWSLRLLGLSCDSRQYLLSSDHTEVPTVVGKTLILVLCWDKAGGRKNNKELISKVPGRGKRQEEWGEGKDGIKVISCY